VAVKYEPILAFRQRKTEPMTDRELGEVAGVLITLQSSMNEGVVLILQRALERLAYLEEQTTEIKDDNWDEGGGLR
jgi:hypothetical protein